MGKAILVLDEYPKSCDKCPLSEYFPGGDNDDNGERYCNVEPGIDDSMDCTTLPVYSYYTECPKPSWCPLKELPAHLPEYNTNESPDMPDFLLWQNLGWNECLDAIEGTED